MTKRFSKLATEGILIVASILIAFAIDAWWEDRQDRHEEQRLLEALKAEFSTNIKIITPHIEGHRTSNLYAKELSDLLGKTQTDGSVNVRAAELGQVINHGSTDPQTGVIDAILQSGELRYITNPEIRERLAGWPSLIVDARENEDMLQMQWEARLLEAMSEVADLYPLENMGPECWSDPKLDVCRHIFITMTRSNKVIAYLGPVIGYTAEAARELQTLVKEAENIVSLINAELEKK